MDPGNLSASSQSSLRIIISGSPARVHAGFMGKVVSRQRSRRGNNADLGLKSVQTGRALQQSFGLLNSMHPFVTRLFSKFQPKRNTEIMY
jgi:hypothetical protein